MQVPRRRRATTEVGRAKARTAGRSSVSRRDELSPALFRRFCDIAHAQAGIRLKEGKEALVSARVSKRQRLLGLPNLRSYLRYLEEDTTGEEVVHFVDVVTTNFTRFFREADHFTDLKRYVEKWVAAGQTSLKVWCAAASTGEEPYSIAMTLLEVQARMHFDFRILATDISTRVLGAARKAVYPKKAVVDVPAGDRQRFFRTRPGEEPGEVLWEVKPEVRTKVVLDRVNLSQPPFPMRGPFDVVFCRNVMIYLDSPVRARLVGEFERLLRPGGILFVGHAETLTGLDTNLRAVRASVYKG